jgi:hypothetical protein
MKLARALTTLVAVAFGMASCKHQQTDAELIRAGVIDHLTALKTLNLSAMDIRVTSVNIQGGQAQAQVEFLPKTGAPAGAGMQVSYALAKENGNWIVQKTLATGGVIEHPSAGANPHVPGDPVGASDITAPPRFHDLLHRSTPKENASTPNDAADAHPPN